MRLLVLVTSLVLSLSSAQATEVTPPAFVDHVLLRMAFRVDTAPVHWADLSMTSGAPQTVEIAGGYSFSVAWDGDGKSAHSVLKGPGGKELHRRESMPQNGALTPAAYVICSGNVLHVSPVGADVPDCPQS